MTNTDVTVSLDALCQEIDAHAARIRLLPATTSAEQALNELAGTVLPILKDISRYVLSLEQAVIQTASETDERIDELEQGMSEADAGTRFDEEDAGKFSEYILASKVLIETVEKNAANPEPVRQQLKQLLQTADELLGIIEESTIEADDDVEDEVDGDAEEASA